MKIEILREEAEYYPGTDLDETIYISLNTKIDCFHISFGKGQPEDMTLARDLSDAYKIPNMLKAAYEAGLRGESLEIIEKPRIESQKS